MKVPGIPYVQGRNHSTDQDGRKYAVAVHNTSNDASAEAEAQNGTHRTDKVSAHFYVDNNSVVQSLDTDDRAWHAGSDEGNDNAIAVEITGVNGWSRAQWLANVAWDQLGRVLAEVCRHHDIPVRRVAAGAMKADPRARGFYSHDAMRVAWGGTTHTDPGPNFPWDRLFDAVNAYMLTPAPRPPAPRPPAPDNWTDQLVDTLPTLRLGDGRRVAVGLMQAAINTQGAGLAEDGVFGPKTDAAVRTWQARHQVPNSVSGGRGDGIFGRSCWTYVIGRAVRDR